MLTKTAELDIKALREGGFSPTDAEIVELNDLAIRIERGKDTTPANMPRVAFAGNVLLHEPTIGAIEWWNNFGRDSTVSDEKRIMTYFFCLAHALDLEYLNKFVRPSEIQKEVKRWKKSVDATEEQLWRALMWVKCGTDDVEGTITKEISNSISDEDMMNRLWMTVIAAAGALGRTPDELKTTTMSTLVPMLMQANIIAHIPMKTSVAKDYIAYRQLLKKIEDRGSSTKEETEEQNNG